MNKIYDVHAHHVFPEYIEEMKAFHFNEDGFTMDEIWTPQEHLAFMDEAGIQWSLLSLSSPHPHYRDDKRCIELIRKINEKNAALKQRYPDRFGFSAALPHPCLDASVAEAIFCLDTLHADAIKLASNSRGLYLGDERLEPLFAELNRRGAVVIIHPTRPIHMSEDVFSAGVVPLFEFLCDTTRAVLNMIANGVLVRYPDVKVVVPHNGSFLPNIYDRFCSITKLLVSMDKMDNIDIEKAFQKLYFDTAGTTDPNTSLLFTCADPNKVMYGSDYPYTPKKMALERIQKNLEFFKKDDKIAPYFDAITADTCRNLFRM